MRRTIPLAALVAVTLGLTACGGDPDPEPAPSSATRPAATSSATASSSASPAEGASGSGGLYVALGDSLAAGYQPGGAELRDTAYPALTATRLEAAGGDLTLENLGCSGETTTSLVKGGKCDFAAGSQLEQAEKLLEESPDVALVTIDIGGNDLLRCVRGGAQIDTACVTAGVGTVKKNLPATLERLRAAAGPDVPVLVLGYYNPWLAAKALDQPVEGVDEAAKAYTALSAAIESAATKSGTTFVGLDQAFSTNDRTPTTINGRSVPKNAAQICTLTNICTARDIHLTDEGAATVARVLAKAAEKAGVS
ncbi:MAG TPA: SGNH/GDSL hydrolase family protein [Ornithinibacter sp.]|nr:SGNH/GDSL hydrolase family protein [Ornithinibacter sp.]